ncbi:protein spitz-like [Anopheles bellator]|uniref:protein spitz-like n=1 Tax=Anopheles bellator TaxID=139047 RepID=UPI0026471CDE|nr:protein spitz-like [Anopheles bellator]XP_058064256.1 protein spitz-like [Anopheles bellator]XP_058064257.1 protein spitz-like [Anopheles bellator]XP_058064258.1 protein spitz-like [Anopheles bellator]
MNASALKLGLVLLIMLSTVVNYTDCCSSRSMPKSRPRPVSHFRGVISTTSTTTISTVTQIQPDSSSPPETKSTVTDARSPAVDGGEQPVASFDFPNRSINPEDERLKKINKEQNLQQQPRVNGASPSRSIGIGDKAQLMRMGRCSPLFEENYCLNGGQCYNFTIANSTMPTCECADGYMGERCESKYLDGTYLSMRKPKIQIETAGVYYGAFLTLMVVLGVFYYLHFFGNRHRHQPLDNRAALFWRLVRM